MSLQNFSLHGKVVVVTGALGLLGKQHCGALAEAGANVVVADLDLEKCEEFASKLPTKSIGTYLNVTDKEQIQLVLDDILAVYGKVDVLVNNAAINDMLENPVALLEDSKYENYPLYLWEKSLSVNLTGVFLCCQIFGSFMVAKGSGNIINIASTYGVVAPDQDLYTNAHGEQIFFKPPAYPVTKAGVLSLTTYLAAYWGKSGVRVNALSPGGVENNQDTYFVQKYSQRTAIGRMAMPTDYRGAIVFLAGDTAPYMTGCNLIVDGGWTIC